MKIFNFQKRLKNPWSLLLTLLPLTAKAAKTAEFIYCDLDELDEVEKRQPCSVNGQILEANQYCLNKIQDNYELYVSDQGTCRQVIAKGYYLLTAAKEAAKTFHVLTDQAQIFSTVPVENDLAKGSLLHCDEFGLCEDLSEAFSNSLGKATMLDPASGQVLLCESESEAAVCNNVEIGCGLNEEEAEAEAEAETEGNEKRSKKQQLLKQRKKKRLAQRHAQRQQELLTQVASTKCQVLHQEAEADVADAVDANVTDATTETTTETAKVNTDEVTIEEEEVPLKVKKQTSPTTFTYLDYFSEERWLIVCNGPTAEPMVENGHPAAEQEVKRNATGGIICEYLWDDSYLYYVDAANPGHLIDCTAETKCVSKAVPSTTTGYFKDATSTEEETRIIFCSAVEGQMTCESQVLTETTCSPQTQGKLFKSGSNKGAENEGEISLCLDWTRGLAQVFDFSERLARKRRRRRRGDEGEVVEGEGEVEEGEVDKEEEDKASKRGFNKNRWLKQQQQLQQQQQTKKSQGNEERDVTEREGEEEGDGAGETPKYFFTPVIGDEESPITDGNIAITLGAIVEVNTNSIRQILGSEAPASGEVYYLAIKASDNTLVPATTGTGTGETRSDKRTDATPTIDIGLSAGEGRVLLYKWERHGTETNDYFQWYLQTECPSTYKKSERRSNSERDETPASTTEKVSDLHVSIAAFVCDATTNEGYYLDEETPAKLHKCPTGTASCDCPEVITPEDGYYLNIDLGSTTPTKPRIITCANGVCELPTPTDNGPVISSTPTTTPGQAYYNSDRIEVGTGKTGTVATLPASASTFSEAAPGYAYIEVAKDASTVGKNFPGIAKLPEGESTGTTENILVKFTGIAVTRQRGYASCEVTIAQDSTTTCKIYGSATANLASGQLCYGAVSDGSGIGLYIGTGSDGACTAVPYCSSVTPPAATPAEPSGDRKRGTSTCELKEAITSGVRQELATPLKTDEYCIYNNDIYKGGASNSCTKQNTEPGAGAYLIGTSNIPVTTNNEVIVKGTNDSADLYVCENNGICREESDNVTSGYYMDRASTTGNIIQCKYEAEAATPGVRKRGNGSHKCKSVAATTYGTDCDVAGEICYNEAKNGFEFKFAATGDSTTTMELNKTNAEKLHVVTVATATDFAGGILGAAAADTNKSILVRLTAYSAEQFTNTGYIVIDNGSDANNKYKPVSGETEKTISSSANTNTAIFVKVSDNLCIDLTSETNESTPGYYKDAYFVTTNKAITPTVPTNDYVITCRIDTSDSNNKKCKSLAPTDGCTSGNEGKITTQGICVTGDNSPKYGAFEADKYYYISVDSFPGVSETTGIVVMADTYKMVQYKMGYGALVINKTGNDANKLATDKISTAKTVGEAGTGEVWLVQCKADNTCESKTVKATDEGKPQYFYDITAGKEANQAKVIKLYWDESAAKVVHVDYSGTDSLFYLDQGSVDETNDDEYTKLIKATTGNSVSLVEASGYTGTNKYYFINAGSANSASKEAIECTNSKCKALTFTETVTGTVYFLDEGSKTDNDAYVKVIECSVSGTAVSGVYPSKDCTAKSAPGTPTNGENYYYLNRGTYASTKYISVIKCTYSNTGTAYSVCANQSVVAFDTQTLTEGTQIRAGYYVNEGNSASVIKCSPAGSNQGDKPTCEALTDEDKIGSTGNDAYFLDQNKYDATTTPESPYYTKLIQCRTTQSGENRKRQEEEEEEEELGEDEEWETVWEEEEEDEEDAVIADAEEDDEVFIAADETVTTTVCKSVDHSLTGADAKAIITGYYVHADSKGLIDCKITTDTTPALKCGKVDLTANDNTDYYIDNAYSDATTFTTDDADTDGTDAGKSYTTVTDNGTNYYRKKQLNSSQLIYCNKEGESDKTCQTIDSTAGTDPTVEEGFYLHAGVANTITDVGTKTFTGTSGSLELAFGLIQCTEKTDPTGGQGQRSINDKRADAIECNLTSLKAGKEGGDTERVYYLNNGDKSQVIDCQEAKNGGAVTCRNAVTYTTGEGADAKTHYNEGYFYGQEHADGKKIIACKFSNPSTNDNKMECSTEDTENDYIVEANAESAQPGNVCLNSNSNGLSLFTTTKNKETPNYNEDKPSYFFITSPSTTNESFPGVKTTSEKFLVKLNKLSAVRVIGSESGKYVVIQYSTEENSSVENNKLSGLTENYINQSEVVIYKSSANSNSNSRPNIYTKETGCPTSDFDTSIHGNGSFPTSCERKFTHYCLSGSKLYYHSSETTTCGTNGTEKKYVGYFKDSAYSDQYIKCTSSTNQDGYTCAHYDPAESTCTAENVGLLIRDGSTVKICTGAGEGKSFYSSGYYAFEIPSTNVGSSSSDADKSFLINADFSGSQAGNRNVLIQISTGGMIQQRDYGIIVLNGSSNVSIGTNTDITGKTVYFCDAGTCTKQETFTCESGDTFYSYYVEYNSNTPVGLVKCTKDGESSPYTYKLATYSLSDVKSAITDNGGKAFFLDKQSYSTDHYQRLIIYKAVAGQDTTTYTYEFTNNAGAYHDGITYGTASGTTSAYATDGSLTANTYYLETDKKQMFYCTESTTGSDTTRNCQLLGYSEPTAASTTAYHYYLNTLLATAQGATTYSGLIQCIVTGDGTNANPVCAYATNFASGNDDVEYYLGGKCDTTNTPTEVRTLVECKTTVASDPSGSRKRDTTSYSCKDATPNSAPSTNIYYLNYGGTVDASLSSGQYAGVIVVDTSIAVSESAASGTNVPGYYVNEPDKTKVIHCITTYCEAVDGEDGNYYLDQKSVGTTETINENSVTPYTKLIKCYDNSGITCVNVGDNESVGFLINAGRANSSSTTDILIKCVSTEENPNIVVKCFATSAGTISNNISIYYLDQGRVTSGTPDTYSHLIKCTTTSNCESISGTGVAAGKYVNAGDTTNNLLIHCSVESSVATCQGIDASTTTPKVYQGYYLNAGRNTSSSPSVLTDQLIYCTASGASCAVETGVEKGIYLDTEKINSSQSPVPENMAGYEFSGLIKCESNKCNILTPSQNGYYINKDTTTTVDNKLIHCTTVSSCKSSNSNASADLPKFYANARVTITNNVVTNLIQCTTDCEEIESSDIEDGYYLDYGYDVANPNTAKGLFECKDNVSCTSQAFANCIAGYYYNLGKSTEADKKDEIIVCATGESGMSCAITTAGTDPVVTAFVATGTTTPLGNAKINGDKSEIEILINIIGENAYTASTSHYATDTGYRLIKGVAADAFPDAEASTDIIVKITGSAITRYSFTLKKCAGMTSDSVYANTETEINSITHLAPTVALNQGDFCVVTYTPSEAGSSPVDTNKIYKYTGTDDITAGTPTAIDGNFVTGTVYLALDRTYQMLGLSSTKEIDIGAINNDVIISCSTLTECEIMDNCPVATAFTNADLVPAHTTVSGDITCTETEALPKCTYADTNSGTCTFKDGDNDATVTRVAGSYCIDEKTEGESTTGTIYKIADPVNMATSASCTATTFSGNVFFHDDTSEHLYTLDQGAEETKIGYRCNSGGTGCETITGIEGKIYVNTQWTSGDANNKKLMSFTDGVFNIKDGNEGFYENYEASKVIKCTSDSACTEETAADGYYVNNDALDGNKMINALLQCTTSTAGRRRNGTTTCTVENAEIGYYANADASENANKIIVCDTSCKDSIADNTAPLGTTNVGNASFDSVNSQIKIKTGTSDEAVTDASYTGDAVTYAHLSVAEGTNFPTVTTAKQIIVQIRAKSIVLVRGYPACSSVVSGDGEAKTCHLAEAVTVGGTSTSAVVLPENNLCIYGNELYLATGESGACTAIKTQNSELATCDTVTSDSACTVTEGVTMTNNYCVKDNAIYKTEGSACNKVVASTYPVCTHNSEANTCKIGENTIGENSICVSGAKMFIGTDASGACAEITTATGQEKPKLTECETVTDSSACTNSSDAAITANTYCVKNKIIYLSTGDVSSGTCTAKATLAVNTKYMGINEVATAASNTIVSTIDLIQTDTNKNHIIYECEATTDTCTRIYNCPAGIEGGKSHLYSSVVTCSKAITGYCLKPTNDNVPHTGTQVYKAKDAGSEFKCGTKNDNGEEVGEDDTEYTKVKVAGYYVDSEYLNYVITYTPAVGTQGEEGYKAASAKSEVPSGSCTTGNEGKIMSGGLCVGGSTPVSGPFTSGAIIKYYGFANKNFPGAKTAEETEDDNANHVLIKVTATAMTQVVTYGAYVVNNEGTNKYQLVTNLDTTGKTIGTAEGEVAVYTCSDGDNAGKCTSVTSGDATNGHHYYDVSTPATPQLIVVKDSKVKKVDYVAGTGEETGLSHYYLDEGSKSETSYGKIITVSSETGNAVTSAAGSVGFYKNYGDNKLIKCSTGSPVTCASGEVPADANAGNYYYLDQGSHSSTYIKVIECSSSSCTVKNTPGGTTGAITKYYYLNRGTFTNNKYSTLIQCTYTAGETNAYTACENMAVSTSGFYINTGNAETVIKCTDNNSDDECVVVGKPALDSSTINHYINAGTSDSSTNTDVLIKCDKSKCVISTAAAGHYINAGHVSDGTNDNLIKCTGTTAGACSLAGNGYTNTNTYYLDNAYSGDSSNWTRLIYCSSNVLCKSIDSTTTGDGLVKLYAGYYVNAGKAQVTGALINCSSNESCKAQEAATASNDDPIYYLDNDKATVGENDITAHTQLIKCEGTANCSSITSTDIKQGYYLNAGHDSSVQSPATDDLLIKCTSDSACAKEAATGATGENILYFLNNAYTADAQSWSQLIKCTGTSAGSCTSIKDTATQLYEGYYLNASTVTDAPKIIMCYVDGDNGMKCSAPVASTADDPIVESSSGAAAGNAYHDGTTGLTIVIATGTPATTLPSAASSEFTEETPGFAYIEVAKDGTNGTDGSDNKNFPGVAKKTSAEGDPNTENLIVRITPNSITRVKGESGKPYVAINGTSHKLLTSAVDLGMSSDDELYSCVETTDICTRLFVCPTESEVGSGTFNAYQSTNTPTSCSKNINGYCVKPGEKQTSGAASYTGTLYKSEGSKGSVCGTAADYTQVKTPGYYVSAEYKDRIITLNSSDENATATSDVVSAEAACTDAASQGKLLIDSSDNSKIKLCVTGASDTSVKTLPYSSTATDVYAVAVTVSAANDFPGVTVEDAERKRAGTTTIYVKITDTSMTQIMGPGYIFFEFDTNKITGTATAITNVAGTGTFASCDANGACDVKTSGNVLAGYYLDAAVSANVITCEMIDDTPVTPTQPREANEEGQDDQDDQEAASIQKRTEVMKCKSAAPSETACDGTDDYGKIMTVTSGQTSTIQLCVATGTPAVTADFASGTTVEYYGFANAAFPDAVAAESNDDNANDVLIKVTQIAMTQVKAYGAIVVTASDHQRNTWTSTDAVTINSGGAASFFLCEDGGKCAKTESCTATDTYYEFTDKTKVLQCESGTSIKPVTISSDSYFIDEQSGDSSSPKKYSKIMKATSSAVKLLSGAYSGAINGESPAGIPAGYFVNSANAGVFECEAATAPATPTCSKLTVPVSANGDYYYLERSTASEKSGTINTVEHYTQLIKCAVTGNARRRNETDTLPILGERDGSSTCTAAAGGVGYYVNADYPSTGSPSLGESIIKCENDSGIKCNLITCTKTRNDLGTDNDYCSESIELNGKFANAVSNMKIVLDNDQNAVATPAGERTEAVEAEVAEENEVEAEEDTE